MCREVLGIPDGQWTMSDLLKADSHIWRVGGSRRTHRRRLTLYSDETPWRPVNPRYTGSCWMTGRTVSRVVGTVVENEVHRSRHRGDNDFIEWSNRDSRFPVESCNSDEINRVEGVSWIPRPFTNFSGVVFLPLSLFLKPSNDNQGKCEPRITEPQRFWDTSCLKSPS